jgi:hypothetical protein
VRISTEEVAGIWLRAAKIEFTIVTEGESADIAIFDRIVFSIRVTADKNKNLRSNFVPHPSFSQ